MSYKIFFMNKADNRGSVALEALMVVPVFMFAMLTLVKFVETVTLESIIYESAVQTAEYMAEYAYLTEKTGLDGVDVVIDYSLAESKLEEYMDDSEMVEKYIEGGMSGIDIFGSRFPDDDGDIILKLNYTITVDIPMLGSFTRECEEKIQQKAYLGYNQSCYEDISDNDRYVYVTENGDVYHSGRGCTHLRLSISICDFEQAVAMGYGECEYCGNGTGFPIYITDEGDKYHRSLGCQGLRRTVYRRKLSEVRGTPPCSRCN